MAGKPYWPRIEVDGVAIDLSHLEPFEWVIRPQGLPHDAIVSVRFNDHCFTEDFDGSRHVAPLKFPGASRHELRAFDHRRYEMSKQLGPLIRCFDGKRISSTREGNLVRVELADGQNYGIFFTLRREAARHCGLFVVSAYALELL